ncbi:MAG: hypothetical protein SFV32_05915 [Opitutaceae bacterium]|nr:hypothetical protein [Opitutaceae bacterium]
MNPTLTSVEPASSTVQQNLVLEKEGYACTLLSVNPGDENPESHSTDLSDRLLFVIEGEVTVSQGEVNTVLVKDQALLIPKGRTFSVSTRNWAKVLRVDVPPRAVIVPQILTR